MSKAHRHLVKEAKRAVRKMGWQIPRAGFSLTLVGAESLVFPTSHVFKLLSATGGTCGFLKFGHSAPVGRCGYSDGGDVPGSESPPLGHPEEGSKLADMPLPTAG